MSALLKEDGNGGYVSSAVMVNDAGGVAGEALWLRAQADGITLGQADTGKLVTPADGGGAVTLPATPMAGTVYEFACVSADSPLTLQAQGLHRIWIDAESGGAVASGSVGGLRLVYAGPNVWIGYPSGVWNLT